MRDAAAGRPAGAGLGLLLVTGAALAWSSAGLFTRLIPLDSWTLLVWRGLFGGLGILLFIALRERGAMLRPFLALGKPGWAFVLMSALAMLCFINSLRLTSVAHVSVIYAVVPFLAAALGWFVLRERPSGRALAASSLALAGVATMVSFGGEGGLWGDLLAFGMTLGTAGMLVIARRFPTLPTLPAACLSVLLSGLVSLPFASELAPPGALLPELVLFGLVSSAMGLVLFALGSRYLPAIETALITALDAPLSPLWVWLAFDERPGTATLVGGAIVFVAVLAHILSNEARQSSIRRLRR